MSLKRPWFWRREEDAPAAVEEPEGGFLPQIEPLEWIPTLCGWDREWLREMGIEW